MVNVLKQEDHSRLREGSNALGHEWRHCDIALSFEFQIIRLEPRWRIVVQWTLREVLHPYRQLYMQRSREE